MRKWRAGRAWVRSANRPYAARIDPLLEAARLVLGVAVLAFLLYAPGAVALNLMAGRHPAPYLFSGVEEWLFTAVLMSVLVTGGLAFVLAEVGWFHWWSVLLTVALCCLLAAALAQV